MSWRGVVLGLAAVAAGSLAADAVRDAQLRRGSGQVSEPPYAPASGFVPFVSLGYREVFADLMWLRLVGYSGDPDDLASGVITLLDAILAADPFFQPAYESGAERIGLADHGLDEAAYLRQAEILAQGADRFPDRWRYPFNAGQTYVLDLRQGTSDPERKRHYTELGIALLERAVRYPEAPAAAAVLAANMLTDLGRSQQAEATLQAQILATDDEARRGKLVDKLAKLRAIDRDSLTDKIKAASGAFRDDWMRTRPAVPAVMYVVLGAPASPRFDLAALAAPRDLIGSELDLAAAPLPALADDVGEAAPAPPAAP